jgi:hypothetical protein
MTEQPSAIVALSDEQITTVMQLARPLSPDQRSMFLEMVAAKLNGRREIGDGVVSRICRTLVREYFDPPHEHVAGGKYA